MLGFLGRAADGGVRHEICISVSRIRRMSPVIQRMPSSLSIQRASRTSERVELQVEIGIDDHTTFYVGVTQNLSSGGVFISTPRLCLPGTKLALTFVMPEDRPFFVRGVVRWVRDAHEVSAGDAGIGMGVQFVGLTERDQAVIAEYVQQHALFFVG
jgi:uncharacterized protein (TIGR02266 family)